MTRRNESDSVGYVTRDFVTMWLCYYIVTMQCLCLCLVYVNVAVTVYVMSPTTHDSWLYVWKMTTRLRLDYVRVWLCSLSTSLWFWHWVASDWWPLMTYDDLWLMIVDFCNLIIVKTPHLSIMNLLALLTYNLWLLIYFCLGSLIWLPATSSVQYGLGSRTSHFIVTGPHHSPA